MINIIEHGDESEVINFIGDNYQNCLYLYANLAKYGLENDNMAMWKIENDESTVGFSQKYFSCMHFYCLNNGWLTDELLNFILQKKPRTILATQKIIEALNIKLSNNFQIKIMNLYHVPNGAEISSIEPPSRFLDQLVKAKIEDINEITDFLMEDQAYKNNYNREILYNQLHERLVDEYSRYYIIRNRGNIIASVSTKAEHEYFAVIGGVMVDRQYRGRSIGQYITSDITNILQQEGKECYSFILKENIASIRMFENVGYLKLGTSGKLIAVS